MTQEDKELLLKDLCAKLPYGVKINCFTIPRKLLGISIDNDDFITLDVGGEHFYYPFNNKLHDECLPYLRPMTSMTEEEKKELSHYDNSVQRTDFFYSHHIDCRFMIEKGLALEAPEDMYK